MEPHFDNYVELHSKNLELKSDETVLSTALSNVKELKQVVLEKEKEFSIASSTSGRSRCSVLVDHLLHYKCVIECLLSDILGLQDNLLGDDEFLHLSLMLRQAELATLKAIKTNQQRNELLSHMTDEEAQCFIGESEYTWRHEHQDLRKQLIKLIQDIHQVFIDKTKKNLEQQQVLLNQRYQEINVLIKTLHKR